MYESDDEQSKREFYYHESNNNMNNNIENDDFVSRYIRMYGMLFNSTVYCVGFE